MGLSRQSPKRKSGTRSRQGDESPIWWLALILVVGGVGGWIWWNSRIPEKEQKPLVPRARQPLVTPKQTPPVPVPHRANAVVKSAPIPEPPLVTKPELIPDEPVAPSPPVTNAAPIAPVAPSATVPRSPRDTLAMQVALSRFAISSGSIDGVAGAQTHAALMALQHQLSLPETGEFDSATRAKLATNSAPLTTYTITSRDLARLQPISKTWLGKSQQTALDYETILELVAERGHASPTLIRHLNPKVDWTNVVAGTEVTLPAADYPPPPSKAAFIVISLEKRQLEAFDAKTNLLAHFPCSIAKRFDKRPVGELHVVAIAPNPDYTFNPDVFPESEEAQQLPGKLILPPGPNNPVGTAWIGLDKPGYGMHGTPNPEQVGRTESHGCFRLANWNAEYLIKLVSIGMPVRVLP